MRELPIGASRRGSGPPAAPVLRRCRRRPRVLAGSSSVPRPISELKSRLSRGERADLLAESVVNGILLSSADLDQTLGLFVLREGEPLRVFATPPVRRAVCDGLNLDRVLGTYCGRRVASTPAGPAG